jgi:tRNA pseudouridine65 synthase
VPPSTFELGVLYRDAALLVVNKPSGLVVHRGWATDKVTALSLARSIAGQWVYPVHRLDRSTSGALVFALNADVARRVEELFVAELVTKRYLALVRGMAPDQIGIDHPIAKAKDKPKMPAFTRVARLASYSVEDDVSGQARSYSWLEAYPLERMALHAESISLPHPTLATLLTVHAPLPSELTRLLGALDSEPPPA